MGLFLSLSAEIIIISTFPQELVTFYNLFRKILPQKVAAGNIYRQYCYL